jgi:hypothetical protein
MLELSSVTIIMKKQLVPTPKMKIQPNQIIQKWKRNPFKIFVLGLGQPQSLCQMHMYEHGTF